MGLPISLEIGVAAFYWFDMYRRLSHVNHILCLECIAGYTGRLDVVWFGYGSSCIDFTRNALKIRTKLRKCSH